MYQIDFEEPKRLHFIGIGGISMSGLAKILLSRGFAVSGSDWHKGPLTKRLEADGALLPCAGVFILRKAVAPTDLLPTLETEAGVIKVDRKMASSIPGVFAAGDCTGGPLQVSKAVGEGHVAALSACEYLDK